MINIGILYIATGSYRTLFNEFYSSSQQYLFPGYKKTYFIFTDSEEYFIKHYSFENIVIIKINNYLWPYPTLFRYKFFYESRKNFINVSHLVFCNANLKFVDYIDINNLCSNKQLFATLHPGYYNKKSISFPYENNSQSTAYLPKLSSSIYVCGGFNGGLKEDFLELSSVINLNIQEDLRKGIIALWHDESHLNKFVACNLKLFNIIDQSYCCPEYNLIIKKRKIIVRDKNNYFTISDRGFKYTCSLLVKKYIFKISSLLIIR